MVSSPMYDRLMQFADSAPENEKLYGWDDEHSTVVKAIRKAQEKIEHFKAHQGFTGQAGDAMSAEAVRAFNRFNGQANFYLTGMSYYVEARRAIMLASEEARQLSPTLLDPMTEAMRDVATVTIPVASNFGLPGQLVNSLAVTGAAYVDAVEAQANAQREAKSTEIIERLESTMNNLSSRLTAHTQTGADTGTETGGSGWEPIPEIPKSSADALKMGTSVFHRMKVVPTVVPVRMPTVMLTCVAQIQDSIREDTTTAKVSTSVSCSHRAFRAVISLRAKQVRARIPSLTRRISWTWTCCIRG